MFEEKLKTLIDVLIKQKHEIYIITARNEDGLPPETYGQNGNFTLSAIPGAEMKKNVKKAYEE